MKYLDKIVSSRVFQLDLDWTYAGQKSLGYFSPWQWTQGFSPWQ